MSPSQKSAGYGFIVMAFALAIAGCGGGGGNPTPPATTPPVNNPTPTPTPTASPPPPSASIQVTYPGQGGNETVSVTVQNSTNPGVIGVVECAYRGGGALTPVSQMSDSPFCNSTQPYVASVGTRAGVQGNYWVPATNHVVGASSFTDTFQITPDSGGDMGMFALVSGGSAAFLNLNAAGVSVSSTPAGTFQVLTSASEIIGPCTAPNTCPTVESLGGTTGGFVENVYNVINNLTSASSGFQPVFQPVEVAVNSSGEAFLATHSGTPPLFGTGTDVTTQGFNPNGSNSPVRFVPCTNQSPNTCNPNQTNLFAGSSWGIVQTGNQVNVSWPFLPAGDVVGFTGSFGTTCGEFMLFTSPTATSGGIVLNFTQVRVENADGTSYIQTTTGVSPPEVCFSAA